MSDIFSLPFLQKRDLLTKTKKRMVMKPMLRMKKKTKTKQSLEGRN